MDEELEMARGRQAAQVMNNPMLQEALSTIESDCERSWKESSYAEHDKREAAYRMMQVVRAFRSTLTTVLQTGKMAAITESERQDTASKERRLREWDGSSESSAAKQFATREQ